jgi:alcohol dehydrogenase class IV
VDAFVAAGGGMLEVPHGALCAALLTPVLAVNLRALHSRAPNHPALHRLGEIASLLVGRPAEPAQAVAWVEALARELGILGLGQLGLAVADIPGLVERARRSSSLRGNPDRAGRRGADRDRPPRAQRALNRRPRLRPGS